MTRTLALAAALGAAALAAPAHAAGDAAAGQALFAAKCGICHSVVKDEVRVGPSLWGVVGRQAGSVPGYAYSDAMAHANRVWTPENLDAYIIHPMQTIPGVKMIFVGLPDKTDRDNVIAYLSTLK